MNGLAPRGLEVAESYWHSDMSYMLHQGVALRGLFVAATNCFVGLRDGWWSIYFVIPTIVFCDTLAAMICLVLGYSHTLCSLFCCVDAFGTDGRTDVQPEALPSSTSSTRGST